MDCREFENLLGKPLPDAARQHLQTCEACRALAQWFDEKPESQAVPLVRPVPVLRAVRPLPSPWWIAAGILAFGGILVAVGIGHLGIDGWNALHATQKIAIFSALGISGATASVLLARQMYPTMSRWVSPAVCLAAATTAILAGPVALMPWQFEADGFTETGLGCARYGSIYTAVFLALIWVTVRRGYFLRPGWAGALAGLVSGSIAVVVLEIYCPLVERSHVLAWHCGVVLVAVMLSAIAAHWAAKQWA
jgi:hypothetical protein